jgi:transcriptional regulator with XRE-family HTH domain
MTLQEIQTERKKRSDAMRRLRKSKGISQQKLAQISGLSWPTIVRIEKGEQEWRIDSELIYLATLNNLQLDK